MASLRCVAAALSARFCSRVSISSSFRNSWPAKRSGLSSGVLLEKFQTPRKSGWPNSVRSGLNSCAWLLAENVYRVLISARVEIFTTIFIWLRRLQGTSAHHNINRSRSVASLLCIYSQLCVHLIVVKGCNLSTASKSYIGKCATYHWGMETIR